VTEIASKSFEKLRKASNSTENFSRDVPPYTKKKEEEEEEEKLNTTLVTTLLLSL